MDAHVAFNDVLGNAAVGWFDKAVETVRALARRHIRVPAPYVEKITGVDQTPWSFEPLVEVMGGAPVPGVPQGMYTLFDNVHSFFSAAIGKPKLVRVDTEETYADFRDVRREPYVDDLDERLRRIEQAFEEHVSDGHGFAGDDVEAFERHLDGGSELNDAYERAMRGAIADTARGGKCVALNLPAGAESSVDCWVDGDEVLLSARMPVGIVTTGAPLDDHFRQVVGCAESVGCCGAEALALGTHLAPKVVGRQLLGEVRRLFRDRSDIESTPYVGVVKPRANPHMAAMMMVLQEAQKGNRRAIREAHKIAQEREDFVHEAGRRLMHAQRRKAEVLGMDAKEFGVNFFGGAHTGGSILLHAFGAGALADQLTVLEAPALPGWAGGTADKIVPPPPQPVAPTATSKVVVVSLPDAVGTVRNDGTSAITQAPVSVVVVGGKRFDGNGYRPGDAHKFSFGYEAPAAVTINLKTGKKVTLGDVKQVMFQGGRDS